MKDIIQELLTHIGRPYQMFWDDTPPLYLGCFYPVYFLYPNYPKYPLVFDDHNQNYKYGIKCILKHCKQIDKSEVQQGDIIATFVRGELHVAIWYEYGRVIEVYRDHYLQGGIS